MIKRDSVTMESSGDISWCSWLMASVVPAATWCGGSSSSRNLSRVTRECCVCSELVGFPFRLCILLADSSVFLALSKIASISSIIHLLFTSLRASYFLQLRTMGEFKKKKCFLGIFEDLVSVWIPWRWRTASSKSMSLTYNKFVSNQDGRHLIQSTSWLWKTIGDFC